MPTFEDSLKVHVIQSCPHERTQGGAGFRGMMQSDEFVDTELMQRILELAARHEAQVRSSARTRDAHAIPFVSPIVDTRGRQSRASSRGDASPRPAPDRDPTSRVPPPSRTGARRER